MDKMSYLLITAAYNEEKYIKQTIDAVSVQTVLPRKWIIVSDGSTDSTDRIILVAAEIYSFITFIRLDKSDLAAGFISKTRAIQVAVKNINECMYNYIGILDADITFDNNYYEQVMTRMMCESSIGIAGGYIYEKQHNKYVSRPSNSKDSVAGAIQLFKKECYEDINGHKESEYGGEDWICEIFARMKGWKVQAFHDVIVQHHKIGSSVRGIRRDSLRLGKMDYVIGSHPLFEILKCLRRIREKPYFIRAGIRLWAYTNCVIQHKKYVVDSIVIEFVRKEQMERIRNIFRSDIRELRGG